MAIIIFSYGRSWGDTAEGALVRIVKEFEDGSIAVSRVCKMLISEVPEYDRHGWMAERENRVTGNWLPVDQLWGVD
jgi:hypothetical protein